MVRQTKNYWTVWERERKKQHVSLFSTRILCSDETPFVPRRDVSHEKRSSVVIRWSSYVINRPRPRPPINRHKYFRDADGRDRRCADPSSWYAFMYVYGGRTDAAVDPHPREIRQDRGQSRYNWTSRPVEMCSRRRRTDFHPLEDDWRPRGQLCVPSIIIFRCRAIVTRKVRKKSLELIIEILLKKNNILILCFHACVILLV